MNKMMLFAFATALGFSLGHIQARATIPPDMARARLSALRARMNAGDATNDERDRAISLIIDRVIGE